MKSRAYKYSRNPILTTSPPHTHTLLLYAPVLLISAFSSLPSFSCSRLLETDSETIKERHKEQQIQLNYKFLLSMQGDGNGWHRGKNGRTKIPWIHASEVCIMIRELSARAGRRWWQSSQRRNKIQHSSWKTLQQQLWCLTNILKTASVTGHDSRLQ